MSDQFDKTPLNELYIFETYQLLEKLENLILASEDSGDIEFAIHEIFRIMHTLKGSAAMMGYQEMSSLAHAEEDIFDYLRENGMARINYLEVTDLVLLLVDFFKSELEKVENGGTPDGLAENLNKRTSMLLGELQVNSWAEPEEQPPKQTSVLLGEMSRSDKNTGADYQAVVFFDEDCGMESIRAFTLARELEELALAVQYSPGDILEQDNADEQIRQQGVALVFSTDETPETLHAFFAKTMFLREYRLEPILPDLKVMPTEKKSIHLDESLPKATVASILQVNWLPNELRKNEYEKTACKQSFISVNVAKMDLLLDLVGELVLAEAMVTQNPELQGLPLDKFYKSARQLRKITGELQDVVMAIRMVPLTAVFSKMKRIVRDMAHQLGKQVELVIIGEQTEVDKNIIENISDPLMHLIRNAVDHGIEGAGERIARGKPATGKVKLEARNAGGDVWIIVQDDGGGLSRDKILKKARERGLIAQEDVKLTDKQIYSFIMHPGFSTKDSVTEFSGRGVGMDVVMSNINQIGGTISVDSAEDVGTTIVVRIPLTLAIIDGMTVKVGAGRYTIPITAIRESFRLKEQNLFRDMDNNEMIMIRGQCYPVVRMYERYKIATEITDLFEGIMIMVEGEGTGICLFVDSLLGQQQVVVKALPRYIKKQQGIAGCTLLGDGSISLILDVAGLIKI